MLKSVTVEVDGASYLVHELKAKKQYLYFNGIAACKDLYGKISKFNQDGASVRFVETDFQEPGELLQAMADLTPEQVDELSISGWWGLLQGVLLLDQNFMTPAPASPPATS